MKLKKDSIKNLDKIGAIAGVLSIVLYISAATLSFLPDVVSRLFAFTFPLLWILSFMGLYRFLKTEFHTSSIEIAYIFGLIGSSIACAFLVVQQANFLWHEEAMISAGTAEIKALSEAAYRGANRVQMSLDIVFDIFISISWILFGLNIAKSRYFNKILGWIGSLIALSLLLLNLYSFPNPPAESGLFDIGPFLGLWSLIFYVWFTISAFKKK